MANVSLLNWLGIPRDSNPDSELFELDSDSRKKGWIRIQLDSDSRWLDSDPDSRCLDSHITDSNEPHCCGLYSIW